VNGEAECESKSEDIFISVSLLGFRRSPLPRVTLKMVRVSLFEKIFNLFRQERKELLGLLGHHQLFRNCHFAVREIESGVAIQVNRADSEISASEVDGHVQSLRR
jgi:hypothetical protein